MKFFPKDGYNFLVQKLFNRISFYGKNNYYSSEFPSAVAVMCFSFWIILDNSLAAELIFVKPLYLKMIQEEHFVEGE